MKRLVKKIEHIDNNHILCRIYRGKRLIHKSVIEYYDYNIVDEVVETLLNHYKL